MKFCISLTTTLDLKIVQIINTLVKVVDKKKFFSFGHLFG